MQGGGAAGGSSGGGGSGVSAPAPAPQAQVRSGGGSSGGSSGGAQKPRLKYHAACACPDRGFLVRLGKKYFEPCVKCGSAFEVHRYRCTCQPYSCGRGSSCPNNDFSKLQSNDGTWVWVVQQ